MKIGSLFSGIGGIDLGFEQAGVEILWANENDKDACKTYRHNFPSTNLFEKDVRYLDAYELDYVDILTAGFPCQPFSVCGNKKGFSDERGNLFFEIMRIADVIQPTVIFLENVANITEHDKGQTFNVIHNELASRDYYIRYLIADACDYGIPQHRTRTYIIAFKSKTVCERFAFPEKRNLELSITDVIDRTEKAEERLYLSRDSYEYNRLVSFIQDTNQIYRFTDYGIQSSKDGISFTLKANMGTWKNRIPFIKDEFGIRKISPAECLALQGFPKNFGFPNIPTRSAYKQSGNTVVVPLVKELADSIKVAFAAEACKSDTHL
ncbi:MAG: DNA (cytosine-5-)-methyltransferase [Firmicutes bacterium]|nr:DNA (cytosine-5-)-methyltransferase [Bacillota bacterium]